MYENAKLNCVIIDDEPLACSLLADYVSKVPFLHLAGIFNNPLLALTEIKSKNINLVLLDILMPELSGLKFSELVNPDCKVIFTTAYPGHALEGYELNAVDYLLKPFTFERFLKAANKALTLFQSRNQHTSEPSTPVISHTDQVLFVKIDYKIIKIFLFDILYIEGLKEYITIHLADKKIITLQNLKRMEELLPGNQFIRVHKSFIVAVNKIDSIAKNNLVIKDKSIPIGDTYKESFFSFLNDRTLL